MQKNDDIIVQILENLTAYFQNDSTYSVLASNPSTVISEYWRKYKEIDRKKADLHVTWRCVVQLSLYGGRWLVTKQM